MPFSTSETYLWRCTRCHRQQSKPTWRLLDSREHPEIIAEAEHELAKAECKACGRVSLIDMASMIARGGAVAPLLFVLPESGDAARAKETLVRESIGRILASSASRNDVPVPVSRRVLAIALQRDVAADLGDEDAACREVAAIDSSLSELYRAFLRAAGAERSRSQLMDTLAGLIKIPGERWAAYIEDHPELNGPEALAHIETTARHRPEASEATDCMVAVTEDIRAGLPADEVYRRFISRMGAYGQHIQERYRRALAAVDSTPGPDGIPAAREALNIARILKHQSAQFALAVETAERLGEKPARSRDDIVEIINLCSPVQCDAPAGSREAIRAALALGLAHGSRSDGDQLGNWRMAVYYLGQAAAVDKEAHPELWARAHMNLGLIVSQHPHGRDDLDKGADCIRAALEITTPESDNTSWVYAQVNLALVLWKKGDRKGAEASYRDALAHADPDADQALWCSLHHDYAGLLLDNDPPDLDRAGELIRSVLSPRLYLTNPRTAAELLDLTARIEELRSSVDDARAVEHRLIALRLVPARIYPELHLKLGAKVMGRLYGLGDVQRAADVSESTLDALEVLAAAQLTAEGRRQLLRRFPRVVRWSVFILAAAGRVVLAVEALERGLARELFLATSRDAVDVDQLREVSSELADSFVAARSALHAAIFSGTIGRARENVVRKAEARFWEVAEEARATGLPDFLRPLTVADIHRAVGRLPVMYIVNAPWGSCALTVAADRHGVPEVSGTLIPEVTSRGVASFLLVDPDGPATGLLPLDLMDPIQRSRLLPEVLQRLNTLTPLATVMATALFCQPDHRMVVIATGLLGLVPLHALPLSGTGRVLDDAGEIFLAPSAAALQACSTHSRATYPISFAGIADPSPALPLPASRAELALVAEQFRRADPSAVVATAQGSEATKAWLGERLSKASYVHLACHGRRQYLDDQGPVLYLADDEKLDVSFLLQHRLASRMVVVSGCHSGHYDTVEVPDEFVGLPMAFLQTGAACVVSSLWQVDDWATTLLMVRFYELWQPAQPGHGMPPVSALREARRWLRALNGAEADAYVREYPELSALRIRSWDAQPSELPFQEPRFWAAFTALGC